MDNFSKFLKPRVKHIVQLGLLAISLFVISIWLCMAIYQKHEIVLQTEMKLDQLRAAQMKRPAPKISHAQQDEQKRWDALKAERNFAWTPLFHAIEKAGSSDIELLEFLPDKSSQRVLLRGEAREHKALMTFLETLASQSTLKNVHLTHQEIVTRERLETLTFEIKATLGE